MTSAGYRVSDQTSRRGRVARLVRRAREAPPSYVAWKLKDAASRRLWAVLYAANTAPAFRRIAGDFAGRSSGSLLGPGEDFAAVVASLRSLAPEHCRSVLDRADRLAGARVFPVLGFGDVALGDPVMWDRDLVSGAVWPDVAAFRLDYVRPAERSDVKVAWEVGRLQFLPWLAQAWLLSRDPAYLRTSRELLADWDTRTNVGMGVQWACPMDVAIRSMNLLWFARLGREALEPEDCALLDRQLRIHLAFLERHRERADVNGNHFFVGLAALAVLELSGGRSPGGAGHLADLLAEVLEQFDADGVHLEYATNYHRLVCEVAVLVVAEMRRAGVVVPDEVRRRLLAALQFMEDLSRDADGHIPLIGDSDSGEAVILGTGHVNDVRALVEAGRCCLGDETTVRWPLGAWLLGVPVDGGEVSRRRRDGVLVRSASGFGIVTTRGTRVVVRSGPPGRRGQGGHDHSDLTAFTLDLSGDEIFVDPGTFSYTRDPARRSEEISAAAHNMLLVDGLDPAGQVAGSVMPVISPTLTGSIEGDRSDAGELVLTTGHDGFSGAAGIGALRRVIAVDPGAERVTITDHLAGHGAHRTTMALHLGSGTEVAVEPDGARVTAASGRRYRLTLSGWRVAGERTGTVSARYGEEAAAPVLELAADSVLPVEHSITIASEKG